MIEKFKSFENEFIRGEGIIKASELLWNCDEEYAKNQSLILLQEIKSNISQLKTKLENVALTIYEKLRKTSQ